MASWRQIVARESGQVNYVVKSDSDGQRERPREGEGDRKGRQKEKRETESSCGPEGGEWGMEECLSGNFLCDHSVYLSEVVPLSTTLSLVHRSLAGSHSLSRCLLVSYYVCLLQTL